MTVLHIAARGIRVFARMCNRHRQEPPQRRNDPHFEKWDVLSKSGQATSFVLPTAETGISGKDTLKQHKREVFYIQINLYFCHKTFNSKQGIFNTELCQGSPGHTVTITHSFTGRWSILQSYNYFLWRFFFSPHIQFPGTTFAQKHSKTSL